MNEILLYFLKSGISMALFYMIYRVFMQKETLYSVNRFYLLGTILLSLALPFLPLENLFIIKEKLAVPTFLINLDEPEITATATGSAVDGVKISAFVILKYTYLGGAIILVGGLIIEFIRLLFLRRVHKHDFGPMKIIFVNKEIIPFSWFNLVFMDHSIQHDPQIGTIIQHEYAHYRKLHFMDLLILELITIFQWFNPLVWLYARSIKEIHEYQADAAVLTKGQDKGTYQALLVNQLTGAEVFRLANAFSKSLTKKRMIMMTKMKSKRSAWLKALIAMPALAILLMAFARQPSATLPGEPGMVKGQVVEKDNQEALPGVSIVIKGTHRGTVSDLNGDFMIQMEDIDANLVFSFVGFKTVVVPGSKKDLKIELVSSPISLNPYAKGKKKAPEGLDEKEAIEKKKAIEEAKKKAAKEKADKVKQGEKKEVFYIVEDLAKFPGGNDALRVYLTKKIRYPENAKEGEAIKIFVNFTVDTDGSIQDIKLKKGSSKAMDKEAYRLVSEMPDWEPAKQRGKPVISEYIIPILFAKQF